MTNFNDKVTWDTESRQGIEHTKTFDSANESAMHSYTFTVRLK